MNRTMKSVVLIASTVAWISGSAVGEDWPNFRGPKFDGHSNEVGFRKTWDEPIPLVWEADIGSAYSSFAIVKDRAYTCGSKDKKQNLYCMDAQTGKIIWQQPIEKEFRDEWGDGTRATPSVHDGRVYILGAHGTLLCVDANDGKRIWETQFTNTPQWGYSGSVLIEGELAIATGGESAGSLAAFDKRTGERKWSCGDAPAGYATPYPFTFGGKRYVVGFTGVGFIIADAETGLAKWEQPWVTDWKVNAATPLFHDGHLLMSSGYRMGSALYQLQSNENGLAGRQVWKSDVLMNKFQTAVLVEGNLYSSDQKALVCVDFLTGKERWRKHRIKHSPLFTAEGHLIMLTEDGHLQIAKADPAGFELLTDAAILSGRCWTVPVLHAGKLYVRNLDRVACFNLAP